MPAWTFRPRAIEKKKLGTFFETKPSVGYAIVYLHDDFHMTPHGDPMDGPME